MTRRQHPALAIALAAGALAGCGLQDPYNQSGGPDTPRVATTPVVSSAARPSTDIRDAAAPATPPLRRPSRRPQPTARAALRAFAGLWVNWNWQIIARQQRRLAALSAGPLARDLAASARHSHDEAQLSTQRPGQQGAVAAIALTGPRHGLVVTREHTSSHGRPDPGGRRYRVYLAELTRIDHGWAISRWEPQP